MNPFEYLHLQLRLESELPFYSYRSSYNTSANLARQPFDEIVLTRLAEQSKLLQQTTLLLPHCVAMACSCFGLS